MGSHSRFCFDRKKSGGRRIGIGGIGPEQVPKQQRPVDEGVVKIFIVVDVDVDVDVDVSSLSNDLCSAEQTARGLIIRKQDKHEVASSF